jgi:HEPN domain-containing protein
MNKASDHAYELLEKADNDLIAAQATFPTGRAFDTVCFHCQQSVEKCLKAVLAWHDVDYPWTHDLREILALVLPFMPEIAEHGRNIISLNPFAVGIRYSGVEYPSEEETTFSLSLAVRVRALVQSYIERQVGS